MIFILVKIYPSAYSEARKRHLDICNSLNSVHQHIHDG